MKVNTLTIEAWPDEEGWTWNNAIYVHRNIDIPDDIISNNQKLLKYAINHLNMFNTNALGGRVVIEEVGTTLLEFQDADNDFEPLTAIEILDQ